MDNNKKEKIKYFKEYCNSKGNALLFYVERLLSSKVSKSEENHILDIVNNMINDVIDVSNKNGIDYHYCNEFDDYLYLLDNKKYIFITNYLNKYSYYDELNLEYLQIITKMKTNAMLSNFELKHLELLINNNKLEATSYELIFNYFLKKIIEREKSKNIISYDSFKKLVYFYCINIMSEFVDNPICIIYDDNKHSNLPNVLYIKEEDLIKLYNEGNINVLSLLYKDLFKIKKYKEIVIDKINNELNRKELKDYIISNISNDYYENNLNRISYEQEGNYYSLIKLIELLNNLRIDIYKQDLLSKKLDEYQLNINNNNRLYNGKEDILDNIFENIIKDFPEYLNMYQQLEKNKEIKNDRN